MRAKKVVHNTKVYQVSECMCASVSVYIVNCSAWQQQVATPCLGPASLFDSVVQLLQRTQIPRTLIATACVLQCVRVCVCVLGACGLQLANLTVPRIDSLQPKLIGCPQQTKQKPPKKIIQNQKAKKKNKKSQRARRKEIHFKSRRSSLPKIISFCRYSDS